MNVALIHDWLTGMRGGERVLERIAARWPGAPIHTLVWRRGIVSPALEAHPIRTSILQRLPFAARAYRWYLPLYPAAIERFDLRGFDVIVSSSHAAAKNVRVPAGAFHLSYVHTPMRYVWDLETVYFPPGRFPWPLDGYVRRTCARLRAWDRAGSAGVHAFVANSHHVAERIHRHYGRTAEVVHPPVDVARFEVGTGARDYYLVAGAWAPYKRVDLAVEACRRLGRRLIVAGGGPAASAPRQRAGGPVEWRGAVSDAEMAALYAGARALLYPGEEDFGIVPVEAMASGCPVVALGRGGVLETVARGAPAAALAPLADGTPATVPGGVLFPHQTVEAVAAAITHFEGLAFDPGALRMLAEPFGPERFDAAFATAFERAWAAWRDVRPAAVPAPA